MANIIVENQVCAACGTDVRSGSLFCYNCGKSVELTPEAEIIDETESASQIQFTENNDENGNESSALKPEEIKAATDTNNLDNGKEEKVFEKSIEFVEEIKDKKTGIHEQAKLKSAASLRRKSKVIQRKKVEVVWEEHESAPNVWFVVVAVILTVLVAGTIYLAMRLR